MKKVTVVLLISLLAAATVFPGPAHAGGKNKERNLLIATSALGGTLAGAALGIFADRAFLVNSSSADRSAQTVASSSEVYQRPAASYTAAPQYYYGYQTGAVAVAPVYVAPPIYTSDPQITGYNEGYLEGIRQGRQQRYYEARRQGYDAGYSAGLGR